MANEIDQLAESYLLGSAGEGRPTDSGPIEGLFRDWERIAGTQEGRALGEAIGRRIGDPDPVLRRRAMLFLAAVPVCEGTKAVIPFVRGDRSSFRGVHADGDPEDLEWWLLWTLRKLISTDEVARDLARQEVLRADGKAGAVAGILARYDADWVRAHREEIERLHPDTKEGIEYNLA